MGKNSIYNFSRLSSFIAIGLGFLSCCSAANAGGVALGATRVIYPQGATQTSLAINNTDAEDIFLIQSWVNDEQGKKTTDFVITPPLFVIQPGSENTLRIMYVGKSSLPDDRESVYYLNSKAIPSNANVEPGKNVLQVATQSEIKLFVRPKGLPSRPEDAPKTLRCSITGNTISVSNPSPYYVTLVRFHSGNQVLPTTMVPPKSTSTVQIPRMPGGDISFQTVNDFGAYTARQSCAK